MAVSYRVLVTGASKGFGRLTAQTLARAGHRVFAGMRDPEGRDAETRDVLCAKNAVGQGSIEVVKLDVTSDASVDSAIASIAASAGGLDVVVNNAGIAGAGMIESFTPEQARDLFETNLFGVMRVNRAALPLLRRQGSGLLIHVSSTLGRYVIPFFAIYTASKFALEAISDGYRYELAPLGIESVVVQPGTFPTGMLSRMQMPADASRAAEYGAQNELMDAMGAGLAAAMSAENAPNPEDVAIAIERIIALPPGKRPIRTVVDNQVRPLVEQINRTMDDAQANIFGAMGLSHLLTTKAT